MGECFDAGTDNLHHPATTFAAYHRAWLRWGEHDTFDQLHQWDQFAVGMQKAEVVGAAVTAQYEDEFVLFGMGVPLS